MFIPQMCNNDHSDASYGQGKIMLLVFTFLLLAVRVFELFQFVPYIIIKDQNSFSLSKRLPQAMLISTNPQNVIFFPPFFPSLTTT